MSYARRKDASHKSIVEGLEAAGIVVFDVSGLPGLGFDILCFKTGRNHALGGTIKVFFQTPPQWQPFEIKTPEPNYTRKFSKPRTRKVRITKSEVKAAQRAPIPIVSTVEDALRYFQE